MKFTAPVLLLSLLFCLNGTAQSNEEKGPHGGNVKTAHEYKIEMVACSEYFEVYIYDLNDAPVLNYGITGTIVYHSKSKADTGGTLSKWGIEGFSAKGSDEFTSCTVSLVLDGRPLSASFENNFTCEPH